MRVGWFHGLVLAVVVVFAPGCRTRSRLAWDALDRLKAERIGVAVVLAQHPALERVLHAEFARPVNGFRIEWSGTPPVDGGPAGHEMDVRSRRIVLHASPDFSPEDQLLALFFEIAAVRSLPMYLALESAAAAGRVDREAYPDELVRIEHRSVVAAKSLFPNLLPIPRETLDRHRLNADLLRAPDDTEAFIEWRRTEFAEAYAANRAAALRRFDELVSVRGNR